MYAWLNALAVSHALVLRNLTVAVAALTVLLAWLVWRAYRRGCVRGGSREPSESSIAISPEIQASVSRLVSLVSRRETGAGIAEFDLRLAAERGGALFAGPAQSKGLRFKTVVADNVPRWVCGDPSRIASVLLNLLDNAVKFTEEGAVCLEAGFSREGRGRGTASFTVHDTGAGIGAEMLARLLASDDAGPGHGLAAARRLVALMGGTMGAESEPRGGSTFWFSAPVEIVEAAPPAGLKELAKALASADVAWPAPLLPRASVPGKRILILENDRANQVATLWGVRTLGYLGEVVSNGQAAFEAWQRAAFDLVLLDCATADGRDTAERIRRQEAGIGHIPIVDMTASAPHASTATDGQLAKPLCLLALARTLDEWLGRRPLNRFTYNDSR